MAVFSQVRITQQDGTSTLYDAAQYGVTATAEELNVLDGGTVTTEELNVLDGVTDPVQGQLDGKQARIDTVGILAGEGSGEVSALGFGMELDEDGYLYYTYEDGE